MVFSGLDGDNRNTFIERAPEVIVVPSRDDVRLSDPDVFLDRLNAISNPSQRLKEYLIAIVAPYGQYSTYESRLTTSLFFAGFCFGGVIGGLHNSAGFTEEFIRRHNASVFDHSYHASRLRQSQFLYSIATRGLRRATTSALLCGSVAVASFGSMVYRDKLYYPDWAISYSAIGAMSRLWVSPRAMLVGAFLGLIGGTFGYGLAACYEKISGMSVTQIRYLIHKDSVTKREARRDTIQRYRQQDLLREMLDRTN